MTNKRNGIIGGVVVVTLAIAGVGLFSLMGSGDESTETETTERPEQALTVRVAEVRTGDVRRWVFAEGTARAVRREYLTFPNAGSIEYIATGPDGTELREGDRVQKGQILARQDQRRLLADLKTAQVSLLEAKTQADVVRAEVRSAEAGEELANVKLLRTRNLVERKATSQQELDEAESSARQAAATVDQAQSRLIAAQAQVEAAQARVEQQEVALEDTELVAPIDAVLAYLNIEEGYYYTPSLLRTDSESAALQSVPMVLIDPSVYEIIVNIPSFERESIQVGKKAVVTTGDGVLSPMYETGTTPSSDDLQSDHLPGKAVQGEVFSVNPAISPGGRAVQVKIRSTGDATMLEDGLYITTWIAAQEAEGVLVVPLDAIVYRDNMPYAWVVDQSTNKANIRSVTLGLQGFELQQILDGVESGDLLVTEGRYQLSEGAKVRLLETETISKAGGFDD